MDLTEMSMGKDVEDCNFLVAKGMKKRWEK